MAAAGTDIGTGSTITWSSGKITQITAISWSGWSRGSVNTSHMGTTEAHTFIPTDLYDPGELTVELNFEPTDDQAVPMVAAAESVTVTFPGADTWGCSAFMTGFEFNDPMEDKMTATVTLKFSGDITITDTV